MKVIPLTRGAVAYVDDDDYAWLAQFKWSARVDRDRVYAVRWTPSGMVYMHRVIVNAPPGLDVDHVRHTPLVADNRRDNLRSATRALNNANSTKRRGGSSVFKGAVRVRGRWRAQICRRTLGEFREEGHAALAYDIAAAQRYGPFAVTNFPVPGSTRWLFGEGLKMNLDPAAHMEREPGWDEGTEP